MRLLKISHRVFDLDDSLLKEKDVIIVGSDQLWNKKITHINDPFYWGQFPLKSGGKIVTYAICMNTDSLSEKDKNSEKDIRFMKDNLEHFSALSVRETSLANVLSSLTSKRVSVSLDPTMTIEPVVWRNFIKNESIPSVNNYVLVYAILERKKV